MDVFTTEKRSQIMRRVPSKNTKPELIVRRLVWGLGYRYRLYCKDLPGKPDLALKKQKKVIFVHGCFWHGHECKRGSRQPKTNQIYWNKKISSNVSRDNKYYAWYEAQGWSVLVIWECEIKNLETLSEKIIKFFENKL